MYYKSLSLKQTLFLKVLPSYFLMLMIIETNMVVSLVSVYINGSCTLPLFSACWM